MRSVLVVALILLAAGCIGQSKPAATSAPATTDPYALPEGVDNILRGRVTALDQAPLANATVEILSLKLNETTGPDGSYEFQNLEPRDYLVVATREGYSAKNQRAVISDGLIFELHFQLEEKSLEVPYNETTPFAGMISCEHAYATSPENVQNTSCSPPGDPNNKQAHDFYVKPGAAQLHIQVVWQKSTELSKNLAMSVDSVGFGHQDIQFGYQHGQSGMKLVIGNTMTKKYYGGGGSVRVILHAAPSVTGDEAAMDVGFALQQNFDVYFTVFYVEPGPPTFSAIP